ncbi:MAG: alpha-amylase family glycosyl hydrolase [Myxococcota bacterium]
MRRINTGRIIVVASVLAMACGGEDSGAGDEHRPPDAGSSFGGTGGTGGSSGNGYGGAGASTGATGGSSGSATGGSAGHAGGPPPCDDNKKYCAHEFVYEDASAASVELWGVFPPNVWTSGIPMTQDGGAWTATVDVPSDFPVRYKFLVDGAWQTDPDPGVGTEPDLQGGGESSVLSPMSCSEWTCGTTIIPDCPEADRSTQVRIVLADEGQTEVALAGSFNSWSPSPMVQHGPEWVAVVEDLAWGSEIQYKFVVDGEWIADPANPNQEPDGYNGYNSVLTVSGDWYTCASDPQPTTSDWQDAVLYFVFVDRFVDGDPSNNASSGVEAPADWQGGDWAGLKTKIEEGYFTDLGVNALWISAPMDNTSAVGAGIDPGDTHQYSAYHGYWPSVLDETEEHFGTMAELQDLVDTAHANGIRVIVDYVMNHVHADSPVYAEHPDWFHHPPCLCTSCGWGKDCWFTDYLPAFDFNNADARAFSVDNALWWIEQTGIDGFRLDAVKHIEDQWLLDLRQRVTDEIEPVTQQHFYMVGETFDGDRNVIKHYVGPSMLDGQFAFPLRAKIIEAMLLRTAGLGTLEADLGTYETFYGPGAIMSTFVGNHDVPRPIHFAQDVPLWSDAWAGGKDMNWNNTPGLPSELSAFERLANAFTLMFTIKGIPLIYYGDEIGMAGAGDPDNRRAMQWSGHSQGQTFLKEHIAKLAEVRAAHPALRRGQRSTVAVTDDTFAYKMETTGDTVYVVINRSDFTQDVGGLPASATNLLDGSSVTGPTLSVPARSSMILVP